MRFLIVDTFYPELFRQVYATHPGLERKPYSEQMRVLYEVGFGRADFLPRNLRALGHEAEQIVCNAEAAQTMWAEEHRIIPMRFQMGMQKLISRAEHGAARRLGFATRAQRDWLADTVAAQVEAFDPDVIFNCDLLQFTAEFWRKLKGKKRRLVGECGYPIPNDLDLRPYDLLLSGVPHFVERFRRSGARAELLRQGFEPEVLDKVGPAATRNGVAFIGSITTDHRQRIEMLEAVCRLVPSLECWGSGENHLSQPLRARIKPPIWGYDMYRQLQRAKVTLNVHIDVAENIAGNMRLYEATGVGTLLITDWKSNLVDMFEPGREVIAYRSAEECAELVKHFLEHETERATIAKAGQERTLREHTYRQRMQQLIEIVKPLFQEHPRI